MLLTHTTRICSSITASNSGLKKGYYTLSQSRNQLDRVKKVVKCGQKSKSPEIAGLPKEVQTDTRQLIQSAKTLGLFIVPTGMYRWRFT